MVSVPSREQLARLAESIAEDLCLGLSPPVEGNPTKVAQIVEEALRANFRAEVEIEREAEQALAELGSSAAGLDRGKLLAGLRERIAKKKGFVL